MRDATLVVTSATASSRPSALVRADTAALPISMLIFLCCSGPWGTACCCADTWSPPLALALAPLLRPALVPPLLVNCWIPDAEADPLLDAALEGLFAPEDEAEADGAPAATGADAGPGADDEASSPPDTAPSFTLVPDAEACVGADCVDAAAGAAATAGGGPDDEAVEAPAAAAAPGAGRRRFTVWPSTTSS